MAHTIKMFLMNSLTQVAQTRVTHCPPYSHTPVLQKLVRLNSLNIEVLKLYGKEGPK